MTREAFFLILIALMVTIGICTFIANKQDNRYSLSLIKLLLTTFVSVFYYAMTLMLHDPVVAGLSASLYFASIDWILYFLLRYTLKFIHHEGKTSRKRNVFRTAFCSIAVLDSISLVMNNAFHHAFIMQPTFDRAGAFYAWKYTFFTFYNVHLAICYITVIQIVFYVVLKIASTTERYRRKFVYLLVSFLLIIAIDFVWILSGSLLDYSLILYVVLTIEICLFTYKIFPTDLQEHMHFDVSESTFCGIICFNDAGKCVYMNQHAHIIFGEGSEGFEKAENYHDSWLSEHEPGTRLLRRNTTKMYMGVKRYYAEEYHLLTDEKNRPQGSYIKMQDRTVNVEQLHEEEYLATHDVLTGFYNKDTFFEKAKEVIDANPEVPRLMICTNIDDFKLINDLFGQEFGDYVIREQAHMLSKASYPDIVRGRISGERMAMLIEKAYFNEELAIQNTASIQHIADGMRYQLHVHLGVYEIVDPTEGTQEMYDKATLAVENLRGNYERVLAYYNTEFMERIKHDNNVLGEFERAVSEKQFEMYLQPQVNIKGEALGAEALCRWHHPERGVVFPVDFVEVLERAGYIFKLDRLMWEEAAKCLASWRRAGKTDVYISVNVSPRDFYFLNLYEEFKGLVEKYEISPRNLRLEITETFFLNDLEANRQTIKNLQDYGFLIEIDDFGSGYSSIALLMSLNVNVVKVDMGFLRETKDAERAKLILGSVIEMTNMLGNEVITEGVETKEQVAFVHKMGCRLIQGYYYSKPISVQEYNEKYMGGAKNAD